jgi:GNAT superfamily N-acetyltransferase
MDASGDGAAEPAGRVELLDPTALGRRDLQDWLAVRNAVYGPPPVSEPTWVEDGLRAHLALDPPDEPQVRLVRRDHSGRIVGFAIIGLPAEDNQDHALAEVVVAPDVRRRGHGTALLRAVCATAAAQGRRTLIVESAHLEGQAFAERFGLHLAMRDVSSVLALSAVDTAELAAVAAAGVSGYRVVPYVDRTPDDLLDTHARARGALADAPLGDLEWEILPPTAARLRALEDWSQQQGGRLHGVLAVEEATGDVAAYTEIRVVPWCPTRGEQIDTAVVPAHRGRGLARLVKAANLLRLIEREPAVVDVETWNGDVNDAMLHVNRRLGFRPEVVWEERQGDVADVLARLGVRRAANGQT